MERNKYAEVAKVIPNGGIKKTLILRQHARLYIKLGWFITRAWKVEPKHVLRQYGINEGYGLGAENVRK